MSAGFVDLHLHTIHSDGTETPEAVVGMARQARLTAIAITDHDTLAGLAGIDKNGDGSVCVQLPTGFETNSRPFGEYFYNIADNNASKPD